MVYNAAADVWMVAGFSDARTVLRDGARFDQDTETMLRAIGGQHLTTLQPPLHTAVRGVFRHEFERGTLERWEPMVTDVIHRLTDPLLTRVRQGEIADLVPDAIHRIPAQVISGMLGLTEMSAGDRFRGWINGILGIMNASVEADPERRQKLHERGILAREEALEFCGHVLQVRREDPTATDLIRLLAISDVGHPPTDPNDPRLASEMTYLQERDLHAQIAQLVIAAQDNTANMMSAAAVYLARYPDYTRAIQEDRSLLPQAIEEILRHHGSIMVTPRLVRPGGADIGGIDIPEGARVWAMNGAANRDPEQWNEPDVFDIYREMKANLAFGFGVHNCIGINLARMEIRIFVTRLLDQLSSFVLVDDEIDYGTVFFTRGPQSVRIRSGSH